MIPEEIIRVDAETETICCDGGQDSLGHPSVYYTFDGNEKIICSYCGKIYIRNSEEESQRLMH